MSVIYGDSNSGKTFCAIDMAHCVSTGREWNGRKVKRGLIVYVAAEGGTRIKRRLAALKKRYDEECGDTAPKPLFALVRFPIDFRSSEADLKKLLSRAVAFREFDRLSAKSPAFLSRGRRY